MVDEISNDVFIPKYQWHVRERLYSRYGIILTGNEYHEMIFDIHFHNTKIVGRDRMRNSEKHIVFLNRHNRFVQAVYSLDSGLIITILPFHDWTKIKHRPDIYVDGQLPYYHQIRKEAA